ncbi:MAG TPA: ATP-binding protein [Opitutaceae bacterium]
MSATPQNPFRSIVDYVTDGVLVSGEDGRVLFANAAAESMLGSEPLASAPLPPEIIIRRPGGEEGLAEVRFSTVEWEGQPARLAVLRDVSATRQGRTARTRGADQDITDRIRAEERIREQAALLDEASDAIMVFDLEGRVSFWSKGAERLYGWTSKEAVGILTMESLGAGPREGAEQVLRSSEWKGEVGHVRKNGEAITVLSRKTLLRRDDGTPKSILCTNTDVTELKKVEAQLLRSQRLEGIGTLAGGIAHDLNNVFAPIIMGIPLLREGVSGEEPTALLDEIEICARRGARMVKQVLVFARGVHGERRNISPAHLLRELEQFASETFPRTYAFSFRAPVDVWPVLGDITQLHQVLLNLVVNARDAMPSGGRIIVSATNISLDENYAGMTTQARPGPYVVLEVMDFGTGIPQGLRERIFEPFFTTKPVGQGTGLGLTTTLAIVKSHHGFIDVYSEERKGTTFRVYLPAQPEGDLSADPPIESLARGNGEWILVVDDEAAVRDTVTRTLLRHGYRALTAANGAEAVALFAQKHESLSLVITDMIMPVMDGQATIHAMRKIRPDIPIIAASGFAAGSEPGKARRAEGVAGFLQKPYTAAALLQALERVIIRK